MLQQRTGVNPLGPLFPDSFLQQVSIENIQEIEVIICIGLSHDDRGFLAFYKDRNPSGIIISIDMALPNYLSSKDMLVKGDIQKIMPELEKNLISCKKIEDV